LHHYYVSVRSHVTSVIRSARLDDATLPVVVIDGLVPGAAYEIDVYAQNENGRSTSASITLIARYGSCKSSSCKFVNYAEQSRHVTYNKFMRASAELEKVWFGEQGFFFYFIEESRLCSA
jgi:hypothetical protein